MPKDAIIKSMKLSKKHKALGVLIIILSLYLLIGNLKIKRHFLSKANFNQDSSAQDFSIIQPSLVAKEIGPDGVNNTVGVDVCGTDLGSMFTVGNYTYSVFRNILVGNFGK